MERMKTNVSIDDLYYQVINSSDYDKVYVLNHLKNATTAFNENNETIPSDTIIMTMKMITKLAEGVDVNDQRSLTKESLKPYLEVVSNILGDNTKEGWIVIINQTGSGANELLDGVAKFMTNLNETDVVESLNNTYVAKASIRDCDNGIHFPNHTDMELPDWLAKPKNKLSLNCDKDSNAYVGIILNNVESSFPSTYGPEMNLQQELNSGVISFSLIPKPEGKLKHPIEITFQTLKKELDNPKCVYWKNIEGSQGYWSSEGCWLHQYIRQDGVIVCKCTHLTSFSVMMSLSPDLASGHYKVLSTITKIGLTISMVFIALNVFVYILFWRYVKSAQSIMKVNLSCVLFLANLIFLIGIDKTTNEVVCTTVAVLLHLLYLMVFFVMLILGIDMLNSVLNPTHLGHKTGRNLLVSYGIAMTVVAVSVGSTQLKGYGTDKYCWLSTETGLIWAFLIPVIVVITVCFN
ncbi:adhesion G protein-coupled receptor E3-like [Ruditapes philippinarum]|uniref:adhesion G protein-coupled receptor E3-like n=1 Tax=Ruditapes philippinarum TaxID=129788 RepID=UPI00295BAF3E|nr:adhesion G protein-coupled receptor E3-like [Ruditapes philippinarum]